MTGARAAAAVRQLLVRVGTVGTGAPCARVYRRTAPVELGAILCLLVHTVLLMLLVLLLVHVPFDALFAQHPLLVAIAKGGIKQRVRVPGAAAQR